MGEVRTGSAVRGGAKLGGQRIGTWREVWTDPTVAGVAMLRLGGAAAALARARQLREAAVAAQTERIMFA